MRLDKFLVDCGVGSRSEVKEVLKQKKVLVNGQLETSSKRQVNEKVDSIDCEGIPLVYEKFVYYVMNKPKGVISATEDARHVTVLDLMDEVARRKQVAPVGRLDIDTHGLLFLTNNGPLNHVLLSPKKHVWKIYRASIEGVMTAEDVEHFKEGIQWGEDTRYLPAQLKILVTDDTSSYVEIHIQEGKFHQVKRMVQACGKKVVDLQRISMGVLSLDDQLSLGEYRRLTQEEMKQLTVYGVELS